jgi:hypothetical protein
MLIPAGIRRPCDGPRGMHTHDRTVPTSLSSPRRGWLVVRVENSLWSFPRCSQKMQTCAAGHGDEQDRKTRLRCALPKRKEAMRGFFQRPSERALCVARKPSGRCRGRRLDGPGPSPLHRFAQQLFTVLLLAMFPADVQLPPRISLGKIVAGMHATCLFSHDRTSDHQSPYFEHVLQLPAPRIRELPGQHITTPAFDRLQRFLQCITAAIDTDFSPHHAFKRVANVFEIERLERLFPTWVRQQWHSEIVTMFH